MMGQHAIHDLHDEQRRKNRQYADREGPNYQIAKMLLFLEHDSREPAQGERWISFRLRAFGTQEHRLAAPDLRQAHFVHRDGRVRLGGTRIADEDDFLFGSGTDEKAGGPVIEQ